MIVGEVDDERLVGSDDEGEARRKLAILSELRTIFLYACREILRDQMILVNEMLNQVVS